MLCLVAVARLQCLSARVPILKVWHACCMCAFASVCEGQFTFTGEAPPHRGLLLLSSGETVALCVLRLITVHGWGLGRYGTSFAHIEGWSGEQT